MKELERCQANHTSAGLAGSIIYAKNASKIATKDTTFALIRSSHLSVNVQFHIAKKHASAAKILMFAQKYLYLAEIPSEDKEDGAAKRAE